MNEAIWVHPNNSKPAKTLSNEMEIPIEIARILVNRHITTRDQAQTFLYGTLDNLHDPFLQSGMRAAVDRLQKACSKKEKILIFGDYDVDGVLSVVILTTALKSLGGDVEHFIPDRISQGYGIKESYMDIVLEKKAKVVVSVDCGIKAVEFVERARKHGVDVIITDHHLPGTELPRAFALLNPIIPDSNYPDKTLAGIGVAFKLIQALFEESGRSELLPHYLKLVSIGTVADVAALRGENRLFVKFGLKNLENVSNPGLKQLMEICQMSGKEVSVGDVGFRIGPRINAAGRMGKADLAVRLFFSKNVEECREIVRDLDLLNLRRRSVENKIYSQALKKIKDRSLEKKYKIFVLGCEEWHRGVIGIVASRLKELFHRPALLFTYAYDDGKALGSGRSIKEFSLIDCLHENKRFCLNYGGHTLAVGCELTIENMDAFRSAVTAYAESKISDEDLKRKIVVDTHIHFDQIDSGFLDYLSLLSPFGVGNSKPIFMTQKAEVLLEPKKLKGKHSKFLLKHSGRVFEALGWGKGDLADTIRKGEYVDIAYSLQNAVYLGEEKLNLSLEDMKKSA